MSSPTMVAARTGMARAGVEVRRTLSRPQELGMGMGLALMSVVILFVNRHEVLDEGTGLLLTTFMAPGAVGLVIIFGGVLAAAFALAMDREDGTLLRLKLVPHGTVGYLAGKVVAQAAEVVVAVAIVLVPSVAFGWVSIDDAVDWVMLVAVGALGLLATLPWGMVLGSLVRRPKAVGALGIVPLLVLGAVSGIFVPMTLLASWLHVVAQVFPVYWLGLGMRSVMLPDAMVVVELGGSWQPVMTIVVLAAWAIAGLVVAPPILRRMARRQSGARMQANRDVALQRHG